MSNSLKMHEVVRVGNAFWGCRVVRRLRGMRVLEYSGHSRIRWRGGFHFDARLPDGGNYAGVPMPLITGCRVGRVAHGLALLPGALMEFPEVSRLCRFGFVAGCVDRRVARALVPDFGFGHRTRKERHRQAKRFRCGNSARAFVFLNGNSAHIYGSKAPTAAKKTRMSIWSAGEHVEPRTD